MADKPAGAVAEAMATALPDGGTALVCFSGGVDSTVLLHLAARSAPAGVVVEALHVNHGLHPDADSWQRKCGDDCRMLGVRLHLHTAELDATGAGIEERARRARLTACRSVGADACLMAHHADDQAETVLLRAFRGSGPRGLAAMGARSALPGTDRPLLRPLLGFPRSVILDEARRLGVAGVNDPSNEDLEHNRNWLRHEVITNARTRFPGADEALVAVAGNCRRATALLDELAAQDDAACRDEDGLDRPRLAQLGHERVCNWLSWRLADLGTWPARRQLDESARQLREARAGFRVEFGDVALAGTARQVWWERRDGGRIAKIARRIAL